MNSKSLVSALAVSGLLAACGSGRDEKPAEVMTGVLHWKIQGVSYRSPTQSGKTDANGHFGYVPGETVVFSVGGIVLGSAPGAADVSLFTLAGMTPPTSELGVRRELNRLRYTNTPLSSAMNRALLLLALDTDGNPDNGIDVSAFESALANARLNFDVRLLDFPGLMSRLAPGMNNNIPASFPLKWLYRSLGVKMAGDVPTRALNTSPYLGPMGSVGWTAVDGNGDIVSTYIDQDADGQADVTVSYERDSLGRTTFERTIRDIDLNRDPDSDHTVVITYDAHGNAVHVVEREDGDADGTINAESIIDNAFDPYGRMLGSTYSHDDDYDGVVDSTQVDGYSLDARGNLLRRVVEVDDGADGQLDGRYVEDYSWDAANRQLSGAFTRDFEGDGQIDTAWRSSATFSPSGNRESYTDEYDSDGDGIYEQRSVSQYAYDSADNATRVVTDYENSGTSYRSVGLSTYDHDHRPLTFTTTYDFDHDGTAESTTEQTSTYDANGFQLSWEYVSSPFDNGFGWIDRVDYTYTPEGAEQTATSQTDFDGDGTSELLYGTTIEYTPSNDALTRIVDQYLGFSPGPASYTQGVGP